MKLAMLLCLLLGVALVRGQACSDCSGCPSSESTSTGTHVEVCTCADSSDCDFPSECGLTDCSEGYVASIEVLRVSTSDGSFDLETRNPDPSFLNALVTSSYIYKEASLCKDVTCYESACEDLPIIGDQSRIVVDLNCESTFGCDFDYDIQFGCVPTGVLTSYVEGGVQVLTDVDDTVVCPNPACDDIVECPRSIAGVDTRLEHGEFYPGVAELMLGLALGPQEGGDSSIVPAKPMFLSARPNEAEAFLSISQTSPLNEYFEEVGDLNDHPYWGGNIDSSLYGDALDFLNDDRFREYGETKAAHYNSLSAERPNTRFVFLGDTGQGDPCGAESMLNSANGDRMAAVLMHVTRDLGDIWTECEDPITGDFTLDLPESSRVHYHYTHSDAAEWLLGEDLISCCSARRVYDAVEDWFDCRCQGACSQNLVTCPDGTESCNIQGAKQATQDYCDQVATDQASLDAATSLCGNCNLVDRFNYGSNYNGCTGIGGDYEGTCAGAHLQAGILAAVISIMLMFFT